MACSNFKTKGLKCIFQGQINKQHNLQTNRTRSLPKVKHVNSKTNNIIKHNRLTSSIQNQSEKRKGTIKKKVDHYDNQYR